MDSIEALASAIAAVRLERPDLSVKQVHAELCKQPAWQEVTVSDVKKVSSKMAKQATRSGSSVAASSTLEPPATAESAAPPRRREKGLRMRQQCATCATVADAGGRYGMCELCVREGLPSPALFCSVACQRALWKSHKQWHVCVRHIRDARKPDEASLARMMEFADQGVDEATTEYDRLIADSQGKRCRGDNYRASKLLKKAVDLKPFEPLGYLCFGDNMGAGVENACRMYNLAAECAKLQGNDQIWVHAMLYAHEARVDAAKCGNIFCSGQHFGRECCAVEHHPELYPSWLSGEDPLEFLRMGKRLMTAMDMCKKSPSYQDNTGEIHRYLKLVTHVGNMQSLGTCFISGGRPEYTNPTAEAVAKRASDAGRKFVYDLRHVEDIESDEHSGLLPMLFDRRIVD